MQGSMTTFQKLAVIMLTIAMAACAPTKNLDVGSEFPVPLTAKTPVRLNILLDETLTTYTHRETFQKKGEWIVDIGSAQQSMFENLGAGAFEAHNIVDSLDAGEMDGTLKPEIAEMQLALPSQTRSRFFEAWIKYDFKLYDREGNLVGSWTLPAYGNASNKDFGTTAGLKSAALAACRDAMAFFSINFAREPVVSKWLASGKPLVPTPVSAPQPPAGNTAQPPAGNATATPAGSPAQPATSNSTQTPAVDQTQEPKQDPSNTSTSGDRA